MPDQTDKKMIIGKLITQILESNDNLKGFIFFLNRLENIRRPTDEIEQVLNDYLCICKNISIKGKKRVKHINDRHVLHCKQNIGFIDVKKIELIASAVLKNTGVKLPITIHDFKRRYRKEILRSDAFSKTYKDLMEEYKDGDEIFEIISSQLTWKQLCCCSDTVLKRDGEQVVGIMKSMN